ncbi:MAG: anthranilate phosphoribosyltransferase [Kineosporiaceae bacterium]|nr:anthranilate phosphoribosyltransferase [Kineosporiaceae bacterium]MBK7624519.1 anthranilate phosphoribosyltransferase [Kineosporiaceae bacterium]MBK8077110.1 anthranilate phosphoribosyltransferase [Kineosporiaceae bacterium]
MGAITWSRLIASLLSGEDLSREQCAWAMNQVMSAEATSAQLAGFLVALRGKGETVEELSGLVEAMLQHAVRIEVPGHCVDVVGTGGDRHHTVNISTMAALVVAGTGRTVVKHGNRAASSSSGAADVLEALGVRLDLPPGRVAELAPEVGITFCFAQVFHPSMRHAAVARRELGVPTAFNFLGPLTNPAQPAAAAIGVSDARMAPIMAGVLADRGTSALLFRGDEGLDEMSTTAPTTVWLVDAGQVHRTSLDAVDLGLARATLADLAGGDATHNAGVVRSVLAGEQGPIRDAVLLNAAAAVVAADGAARGLLVERMQAALEEVAAAVDGGAAASVLDRWVVASAS